MRGGCSACFFPFFFVARFILDPPYVGDALTAMNQPNFWRKATDELNLPKPARLANIPANRGSAKRLNPIFHHGPSPKTLRPKRKGGWGRVRLEPRRLVKILFCTYPTLPYTDADGDMNQASGAKAGGGGGEGVVPLVFFFFFSLFFSYFPLMPLFLGRVYG